MFRFALVDDMSNVVTDIAVWDGSSTWPVPVKRMYMLADNSPVDIGWTVDQNTRTFFQPQVIPGDDGIRRLSKIYFMRCFTDEETIRYNGLRRKVTNLTEDDYTDPAKLGIVAAEVFFQRYDATDIIELDHYETQTGLALLSGLGIFGPIPEVIAQRVAAITAGLSPTGIPVDPSTTA